jgi:hypothetical protein
MAHRRLAIGSRTVPFSSVRYIQTGPFSPVKYIQAGALSLFRFDTRHPLPRLHLARNRPTCMVQV